MTIKDGCPRGQVMRNKKCVQPALFTFTVGGNEHIRKTEYYPPETNLVTMQNDAMDLIKIDKGGFPHGESVAGYKHLKVFYDTGTLNIKWGETALASIIKHKKTGGKK